MTELVGSTHFVVAVGTLWSQLLVAVGTLATAVLQMVAVGTLATAVLHDVSHVARGGSRIPR